MQGVSILQSSCGCKHRDGRGGGGGAGEAIALTSFIVGIFFLGLQLAWI